MIAPILVDGRKAAALYGISYRSFLRRVACGEAPAPIRLGRLVRWRVSDLEAFVARLAAAEQKPGPEARP
jgi:predicted DNA-binding transcriptional regulator AlpA